MDEYFYTTKSALYYSTLIFVSVYGLLNIKEFKKKYKLLTILVIITLISEISAKCCYYYFGASFPPYHLLIVITIMFQAYIYAELIAEKEKQKRLLVFLASSTCLLSVINSIFYQTPFTTFPTNGIILLSLFTITLTLITFTKMIGYPSTVPLKKQPMFWFNTGNFIFYNLTFFVFAFFYHFYPGKWASIVIWAANITMYIFYYLALKAEKNKNYNE